MTGEVDKYWEKWTIENKAERILCLIEQARDETADDCEPETEALESLVDAFKHIAVAYLDEEDL